MEVKHKAVQIKDLKKTYRQSNIFGSEKDVNALNGINLNIYPNETVGLVGESGCGKTTTGKLLAGLIDATSGEIWVDEKNIVGMPKKEKRSAMKDVQMIFQDPYLSLNPIKNVLQIISRPLMLSGASSSRDINKRTSELLELVGLRPEYINKYPHEFSGGQMQRIGIARALASAPKFIVCDEPVSALDVSIRAQILNLLIDTQKEYKLAYLFISHDLSVIEYISDKIAVMYLGKIVEFSKAKTLLSKPLHPYTRVLLSAIPIPDPINTRKKKKIRIKGETPSAINLPSGCYFHPRCPYCEDICVEKEPELLDYGDDEEHLSACHFSKRFK